MEMDGECVLGIDGEGPHIDELMRSLVIDIVVDIVERVERTKKRRRGVIERGAAAESTEERAEANDLDTKGDNEWISFLENLLEGHTITEDSKGHGNSSYDLSKSIGVMKKHSRYNLYQVKALQQHDKYSCGYFALFFAARALYVLQHECTPEELHSLACRAAYHYYRALWQEQLRRHALYMASFYPWDEQSVATGIVERPYLLHLIENDPELQALGGAERLCALHDFTREGVSQGIVGIERLERLDYIASEFKKMRQYHQAFLIGSIAHWMVVIVRKVANGVFESIFIDSYNHIIIEKSINELEAMVNHYLDTHPSPDSSARPRRLQTGVGIHRGMQFALETLQELIVGNLNMVDEALRLRMERFVSSYCTTTSTVLPGRSLAESDRELRNGTPLTLEDRSELFVTKAEYVDRLSTWMQEGFHPRFIANEAAEILTTFGAGSGRLRALGATKLWLDHLDAVKGEQGLIPPEILADSEHLITRFFSEALPAVRAVLSQCSL